MGFLGKVTKVIAYILLSLGWLSLLIFFFGQPNHELGAAAMGFALWGIIAAFLISVALLLMLILVFTKQRTKVLTVLLTGHLSIIALLILFFMLNSG